MPPRAFFLLMCVVCKYKAGEREFFLLVLDFFMSSQMFTQGNLEGRLEVWAEGIYYFWSEVSRNISPLSSSLFLVCIEIK